MEIENSGITNSKPSIFHSAVRTLRQIRGKQHCSAREAARNAFSKCQLVKLTRKMAQLHCENEDLAATNRSQDNAQRGAKQGPATSLLSSNCPGTARSEGLEEAFSLLISPKKGPEINNYKYFFYSLGNPAIPKGDEPEGRK